MKPDPNDCEPALQELSEELLEHVHGGAIDTFLKITVPEVKGESPVKGFAD